MAKTIIALFSSKVDANNAIDDLHNAGFTNGSISIIVKDSLIRKDLESNSSTSSVVRNTASGATTGGIIGGLLGLLSGLTAVNIPGIWPLLIAGPFAAAIGFSGASAATLSGTVTGAAAGGIAGLLASLGLSNEKATGIKNMIGKGDILLSVEAGENKENEVTKIFGANRAEDITSFHSKR
jgi:uncharacterized membrane protein